jgi:hypothetical protein
LTEKGKLKAGQPLMQGGKIVSQKKGHGVADGPFAKSKEEIAGYFLLQVDTLDEAVVIAKDYPALEYGATVEVRPVAPECSLAQVVRERTAEHFAQRVRYGGAHSPADYADYTDSWRSGAR